MKLLVKNTAKNKMVLVGEIKGDKLIKRVEQSKHFMRNENGYGIQADGLMNMVKRRVKTIRIIEEDTRTIFEVPVSVWDKNGTIANYGHGSQVFLSIKYYTLIKKEESESAPSEVTMEGRVAMLKAWKDLQANKKKDTQLRLTIDKYYDTIK